MAPSLGRGRRIIRKMKGLHSLRRLVRGAEREIELEWERMERAIYSNGDIDEERFSFTEGDDADGMRTSTLSDAETLVAVMDSEIEIERRESLKEEDQQQEQRKEGHLEDLSLEGEEEEKLEIPPRHPGRITRAWMATTPLTPSMPLPAAPAAPAAPAEVVALDTKQNVTGCCRRRSGEKSSQDSLPLKLRLDEVRFWEFCEGCRKKVVWMADPTE
jgi:hypothetical protein